MASGGLSVTNGLNITKVILAFITVVYDLFFCFQHYCLYRQKDSEKYGEQAQSLVNKDEHEHSIVTLEQQ